MPQAYWIIPLEGGQVDNTLPGGRPPHVGGGPIYHPGHPDHGLPSQPGHPGNRPPGSWGGPTDPGYGQGGRPHPGGGPIYHPGHPDHGLPSGGHIDNALPEGEEVEISNELPPVPPEYSDKVIVAIKRPDEPWKVMAYAEGEIDNSLPPSAQPK